MQVLKDTHHSVGKVINADHQDCGAYKATGNDKDINHQRHMDELRDKIREVNPDLQFVPMILKLEEQYRSVHHCPAVAIILGDPEVLRVAFDRLAQENLQKKHDTIARPFNLRDHDSLLEDLKVSTRLHRSDPPAPFTVYIFDRDEDNAMILEGKVAEIAKGAKVETIIVPDIASEAIA